MFKLLLGLALFVTAVAHAQILVNATSLKRKTFVEIMPKEVVDAYEKNVKDLKNLGFPKKALKVGDKVPDFKINLAGKEYPISSAYALGSVVLKFIPGKNCASCIKNLKKFNELNQEFQDQGAQVIAFSQDTDEDALAIKKEVGLSFDVLGDSDGKRAELFSLNHPVESEFVKSMKARGLKLDSFKNKDKSAISLPATYLVNKDGKIAFSYVEVDTNKPVDPKTVLLAVKEMKKILK